MSGDITQRFAEALQQAEQTGSVDPIVEMFDEESVLRSPERDVDAHGTEAIRAFWTKYLGSFRQIKSEFSRVHENGNLGILEWESHGELQSGQPIAYRGVSLLDLRDGHLERFTTYYDTAALVDTSR